MDDISLALCALDTWQERAMNAQQDLGSLRVRLEVALGDFEHRGDKSLLVERLHKILDDLGDSK